MKRSQRMRLVVELAERAEDEAARLFQSAQTRLADEHARLAELANYYRDYEQTFGARLTGFRASELGDARLFLQRLKDAERAQELQIARVQREVEQAKQHWLALHLKRDNLHKLVQRYREEEASEMDKIEQKMLDEWVGQNHNRR